MGWAEGNRRMRYLAIRVLNGAIASRLPQRPCPARRPTELAIFECINGSLQYPPTALSPGPETPPASEAPAA